MNIPARVAARAVAGALLALLLLAPGAVGFDQRDAFMSKAAAELTGAAALAAPPAGFVETAAFSGIGAPTAVRFAPNGHVFVAEKAGRILEYDALGDATPSVYADLRTAVLDYEDRGLLGLAIDPAYATGRPFVYALYTYDKDPFAAQAPRWNDDCPSPTTDGCVASARLSKLTAGGGEQVLIQDWCQQYTSHSIGDLAFGPDGALYVSGGDGALLHVRRLRPGREPGQPVRRSARRSRRGHDGSHRGGRRAPQPGCAHARRPGQRQRHDPARGPGHGRGAA